jgi:hypothetical protein
MAKRPNAGRQALGQRRYRNGIEKVCFAPIVLKKSFFVMTENSQDRWCVSRAAM